MTKFVGFIRACYLLLPTQYNLVNRKHHTINRVFAENLVRIGFLRSVSYIQPFPNHEKLLALGKNGPNATFNLFFLGLGSPWVGGFVGFIIIPIYFPTQQNLVHRKHPIRRLIGWLLIVDWLTGWSVH